jgi:hypothetical protein
MRLRVEGVGAPFKRLGGALVGETAAQVTDLGDYPVALVAQLVATHQMVRAQHGPRALIDALLDLRITMAVNGTRVLRIMRSTRTTAMVSTRTTQKRYL